MTEYSNAPQINDETLRTDPDILRAEDVIPGSPGHQPQGRPNVPEFDLADQILSVHRKLSSVRRKAPGTKSAPQSCEPDARTSAPVVSLPSEEVADQDRIISQIVAEDIARLCRVRPAS